ncbi:MAG: 5'/3'-nucleotidase SurE [Chloroflexi bacterium]|nr:5'/3'-nucleotidase SurE [Chloroflexota bacterium]
MTKKEPQILLTNDDGIDSPGLWAAAEALDSLGYVWVVAPREQSSGAGRSMPTNSDGRITKQVQTINEKEWSIFAVGGSPAQTVQHAILEIIQDKPDLVVSGINYGENLGVGVTVSGTVGAALEGAAWGVPSLAISLETAQNYHLSHSKDVDFTGAGHFTTMFSKLLLEGKMPASVDVIKVDIPWEATPKTPWEVNRLSRTRYYQIVPPKRESWDEPASVGYSVSDGNEGHAEDSDVYAVRVKRVVSVTPISLDMTSKVDLADLAKQLRK